MKKVFTISLGVFLALLLCINVDYAAGPNNIITVPGTYATIEEAVENANAGDMIIVGQGTFKGAVIDKEIHIKGSGKDTIITEIFELFGQNAPKAGFYLPGATASNTSISHMSFKAFNPDNFPDDGVSFPVFCREVDAVKVSHISSERCVQGVTFTKSTNCEVGHCNFSNVTTFFGGGGGIGITMSGEGRGHDIAHNYVSLDELFPVVGFSPVGIGVTAVPSGTWPGSSHDVIIRKNRIDVITPAAEGTQGVEISTHAGYLPAEGNFHTGIMVAFNDLRVGDPTLAIVARGGDDVTAIKNLDGSEGGRGGWLSIKMSEVNVNSASGRTGFYK